jgi:hypothetical protein
MYQYHRMLICSMDKSLHVVIIPVAPSISEKKVLQLDNINLQVFFFYSYQLEVTINQVHITD